MAFKDTVVHAFEVERCQRQEWGEVKGTHFHNCYEFYYLTEGEITYFVGDQIYTTRRGDVILIPPYALHKTSLYQNPRHTRILIYFTEGFVQDFLRDNPKLLRCFDQVLFTIPDQKKLEALLELLLEEYQENMDVVMVKSLLGQLLTLLNRWIQNREYTAVLPRSDELSETVMQILRYINEHYAGPLTLDLLARAFFLNPSYLSRIFKGATGMGYSEYVTQVRIGRAMTLLKNTADTVTDVALSVGFRSVNHFCKTFKRIVGMPPMDYRKL